MKPIPDNHSHYLETPVNQTIGNDLCIGFDTQMKQTYANKEGVLTSVLQELQASPLATEQHLLYWSEELYSCI